MFVFLTKKTLFKSWTIRLIVNGIHSETAFMTLVSSLKNEFAPKYFCFFKKCSTQHNVTKKPWKRQ